MNNKISMFHSASCPATKKMVAWASLILADRVFEDLARK
jgi:hypothetical protein